MYVNPNREGGEVAVCLLPQVMMKEVHGAPASFLDAVGEAGVEVIAMMEELRPDPPVGTSTVRPLRSPLCPAARVHMLGLLPSNAINQAAFRKATEGVEVWQWAEWH